MSNVKTEYSGGSRFYVKDNAPDVQVPGVTSIIGMLAKPFLAPWQAKMAAELAVDSYEYIGEMARRDHKGAVDYVKGAARRYTQARSKLGSSAHDAFERLMNGETLRAVHPDIVNHVRHFNEFLAAVNPELISAENVAWSDQHSYAGSYDCVMRVWLDDDLKPTPDRSGTPRLLIVDYKTSRSTYPDVALQLAAYAHADRIIDPDGNEIPMPELDGAAVLHITEDQWTFKSVRADEEVFRFFLALRTVFDWDRNVSKKVLGKAFAKSGRMTTGTERRSR